MDVRICEVGLRDGLQSVAVFVPTGAKVAWAIAEARAGIPELEVTSFVPAKVIPQFQDATEVVEATQRELANASIAALVPNSKGAERAFAAGVDAIDFVMSVSHTHSQRNVNREPEESLAEFRAIVALRSSVEERRHVRLTAGLATSLGCSYEGSIRIDDVRRFALELATAGADEILLADTVGYGDPALVRNLFSAVIRDVAPVPVGAHFHDTRGLGLANVVAALDCDAKRIDASLGGLGGCPFALGATGNIVTEDVAFMLDAMGVRTGIDLEALLEARAAIASHIPSEVLRSAIVTAGLPTAYVSAAARAAAGR